MEHLMKMRTRFQLNQPILYKKDEMLYKGRIVGLHDDFVFALTNGTTFRVDFEDVIARV